ncbi:DUF480 domain-containing protein, partial [Vibrio parahaemolyticus]|nr:DUF480 domain-containing protein [Vibrio parahaemolyticus]
LFCGDVDASELAAPVSAARSSSDRVSQLELEVAQLKEELDELKAKVESLLS